MSVKLTQIELEAALNFIEEYGNSVFLPQPFEISAIRYNWNNILPILMRIDLLSYRPERAFKIIAPKQKYTVRPIHLLNPIDNILFTGLVYRLASTIEEKRTQVCNDKIFSMRFKVDNQNGNFILENDWEKFSEKLKDKSSEYEMVAKADIVDFFSRIYLHRLENSVDSICGMEYEIRSLMRFLEHWSNGTSYGIPVGPLASNIRSCPKFRDLLCLCHSSSPLLILISCNILKIHLQSRSITIIIESHDFWGTTDIRRKITGASG